MNENFRDAWHHLRWASRHIKHGITDELSPVRARIRNFRDDEDADETRRERLLTEAATAKRRLTERGRTLVRSVRSRHNTA